MNLKIKTISNHYVSQKTKNGLVGKFQSLTNQINLIIHYFNSPKQYEFCTLKEFLV